MRSSSGAHFIALDHVRALAAFMVFTWHFAHADRGYPVPFNYAPSLFPLALLDEGHTGVALFMTLSGYLFARLLDGKRVDYGAFLWNRALRLLPLLSIVILLVGVRTWLRGENLAAYARSIAEGVLMPTLPNGGWSLTAEFHYYLIIPLFLWMLRKSRLLPLSIVAVAVALRWLIYLQVGEIQSLAFWTIVGRIDQFALGMLAYQFRSQIAHRHILVALALISFCMFYWYFDRSGGFYNDPYYPSPSPIWVVLTTVEGLAYGVGIAWYDGSFSPTNTGVSAFIGRIGEFSYSIYLLHFFVVFKAAAFVQNNIMNISNFYLACLWSILFFLLMMPAGYLSFRFIEAPFLRLRKRYLVAEADCP